MQMIFVKISIYFDNKNWRKFNSSRAFTILLENQIYRFTNCFEFIRKALPWRQAHYRNHCRCKWYEMTPQCILRAFTSYFSFTYSKWTGLLISQLKSVARKRNKISQCRIEIFSTKDECFHTNSSKCYEIESNPRNSNNSQLSMIFTNNFS